jgi:PAS domain S-box-containing protein
MDDFKIDLTADLFAELFPFHIAFDKTMKIIQVGKSIKRICHLETGSQLSQYFSIKNFSIDMEFNAILKHAQEVFVLVSVDEVISLRGEMLHLTSAGHMVFLCSPAIADYDALERYGLVMSDFAIFDPVVDFLLLLQSSKGALSDARQIADKLVRQRGEIEVLNKKLREAEGLNNMVVVVNNKGIIDHVSSMTLQKLHYNVNELKGEPLKKIVSCDAMAPYVNELANNDVVTNLEKNYIRKDGQAFPVLFSASALRDEQGVLQTIVCTAQDISELKETQEQLIQAQKLESIGQLAGGIAHDFNNMLGGILGNLELLKEVAGKNTGKETSYILAAEKAAKRSAELVQKLLGFARKGKYEKTVLNLNDILLEAKTVLCRTIDKIIDVKAVLAPDLWPVEGDSSQLFQVLMNLGLNARDAMPKGGELLLESKNLTADAMYCRYHQQLTPGDYVCITVSDVGIGMEADQVGKIFDPFYTTKDVGKGTGLGLSMVYGIVHNHSGVITVYSELDTGTLFHLYLPRFDEQSKSKPAKTKIKATQKRKKTLLGKRMLVVDDEEVIREIAKEILEKQGAIVNLAKNGEEGIAFYKAHMHDIDLVILDIVMPVMDGVRVFHALKKINPNVKVIFASGYAESDKITKIKEAEEVVAFIQKPFIMADFLSLIYRVLREQ